MPLRSSRERLSWKEKSQLHDYNSLRPVLMMPSRPPPMNVLPLVNKSLALFQWKKDGATAEQFCLEALQIDPLCEAAFATLGQIYLAQQQFEKALAKFRELTHISSNAPQLSLTFYHIYVRA